MDMDFIFENQRISLEKSDLEKLGFSLEKEAYCASFPIMGDSFSLKITIDNELHTQVIDLDLNEPYDLYKLATLKSGFAYMVKMAVEEKIRDLFSKYLDNDLPLHSNQFQFLTSKIEEMFGNEIDSPFHDIEAFAFRCASNHKWYGLAMPTKAKNLGLNGDSEIPVLLLRAEKGKANLIIDNAVIFPAYHMNKSNWVTIPLDYRMEDDDLLGLLLKSRQFVENGQ